MDPIFDPEPVVLRRAGAVIRGPLIGQLNDCPICRYREGFPLVTEIAARRAMSPKDGAISFQHGEARIALCDQKPACWQRHEGRRSVIALSALRRYCAPCSATGLVPSQDWDALSLVKILPTRKECLSVRGPGDAKQMSIIQTIDVWSC